MAWTVHLEHEGQMLSFLLDIAEVAEVSRLRLRLTKQRNTNPYKSHTGAALAKAFQTMLEQFGLSDKVCTTMTLAY